MEALAPNTPVQFLSDHDDTIELTKPAEEPDNSFSSEGETLANLNASQVPYTDGAVFQSPSGVPIVYELASLLPKTTTHTSVVYTDSVVTSVSTSIGLIPIAPPKATTSFFSSDTTNVVSGPTATGPSIYFGTGHIGHTDHIDHTDHTDDSDEADQSVHSGEVDHLSLIHI